MRAVCMIILSALALVGCSDAAAPPSDAVTTSADAAAPSSTDSTPPTTVRTIITTSLAPRPGVDEQLAFEPLAGTPPAVFKSFVATADITMDLDGSALAVTGSGIWATNAFECSITMDFGGFALTQRVVATPEQLWLDSGSGFEQSSLLGGAQEVMATCPASPLFWADFTADDFGAVEGSTENFAGREAVRIDIADALEFATGIGMVPDLEDGTIDSMIMWIDTETNVVLGLEADMTLDPDVLGDLAPAGEENPETVGLRMELRVEQVNDPHLAVTTPDDS